MASLGDVFGYLLWDAPVDRTTAVREAVRMNKELIAGVSQIVRQSTANTGQSNGSHAFFWHWPIL